MKKQGWMFLMICSLAIVTFSVSFKTPSIENEVHDEYLNDFGDEQDWNTCVDKSKTEWGGGCMNYGFSETKYSVQLINKCTEPVDLMCCVQYENGRWQCFYRMDMTNKDTLNAYACRGTGKFLKWVRKAGDVTTKFPSREQVNAEY